MGDDSKPNIAQIIIFLVDDSELNLGNCFIAIVDLFLEKIKEDPALQKVCKSET